MSIITGTLSHTWTGRHFHYRAVCEQVSDAHAFFGCAISEPSKGMFWSLERGSTFEGMVPIGPDCVPVELAVRSRVLSYIERTDFGECRPPPLSWIGWYGPL